MNIWGALDSIVLLSPGYHFTESALENRIELILSEEVSKTNICKNNPKKNTELRSIGFDIDVIRPLKCVLIIHISSLDQTVPW